MSSPAADAVVDLGRAAARARRFLTERQDDDGHWRDYRLEPGRSEAWTTACVGYALCRAGDGGSRTTRRAAHALRASLRPGGWGYNARTACDADSTAWAIRFLAELDALDGLRPASLIAAYVAPSGAVTTFASAERFGSWAAEHAEVTPVAGLALLAVGERELAAKLRAAAVASWAPGRGWAPFWWRGDAYVAAQNLSFLTASGGVPDDVAAGERERILAAPDARSAFEAAQRLTAAVHLDAHFDAVRFRDRLIALQSADGGWPASPALLVPSQGDPSQAQVYSDDRRLLGTALALGALAVLEQRQVADARVRPRPSADRQGPEEEEREAERLQAGG